MLAKDVLELERVRRVEAAETEDEWAPLRIPAAVVALTAPLTGLELGGAGTLELLVSPAFSARVFRLVAGSGTAECISAWRDLDVVLLYVRPVVLCFVPTTGGGIARELLSLADNSWRPRAMPEDSAGSLLGGLMPVGRCESECQRQLQLGWPGVQMQHAAYRILVRVHSGEAGVPKRRNNSSAGEQREL